MAHDKILGKQGNEIHLDVELHPGEVLAQELEARGLKKSAFAMKIGVYPSHFNDLLKGKRDISARIALRIEQELGIAAEFWLGLQMDYDLHLERGKLKRA
jgi:addiction module HigA family antidote